MSMQSWRAAFYPERAFELVARVNALVDPAGAARAALEHSLLKWTGLLPENLLAHDVEISDSNRILRERVSPRYHSSGDALPINSATCALCALYCDNREAPPGRCRACPLARSRGGVPCDVCADTEGISPWGVFLITGNPEPMLNGLRAAAVFLSKEVAP